jgi:hypothetical protein
MGQQPRRQIAITSASVTSCAVIAALIDQPTTRLEKSNNSGHIEPAFRRPDIREVGDPIGVWAATPADAPASPSIGQGIEPFQMMVNAKDCRPLSLPTIRSCSPTNI